MIHIIVPVHNRLELSKKCLRSLDEQSYKDWCVYFVDDGSSDGTYEWLQGMARDDVVHIVGTGEWWWTGAMKRGVDYIMKSCDKEDYIMSLNNDLVFKEHDSLLVLFNAVSSQDKAICGSISVSNTESEIVMSSGSRMISWFLNVSSHPFIGESYDDIRSSNIKSVDMLTGRSVIYPTFLFESNNFDDINFPQYAGDVEFTARMRSLGYKLLLVPNSAVLVSREDTGLNPMDRVLSFSEMVSTLFSIRSSNNILVRTRFSMRVPPLYARPTFFIMAMVKIFIQLWIGNYIARKNK
jgi:GT2 family glycosyltransferase